MSFDMIADTTDDICVLCRQALPIFLSHEKAAFTLGALLFPDIGRHLIDCDECANAANLLWPCIPTPGQE